jgi:hypothetical protein
MTPTPPPSNSSLCPLNPELLGCDRPLLWTWLIYHSEVSGEVATIVP